jgi:hypothetical protein
VPDFDLEPEPTEIVFLVDCSGLFLFVSLFFVISLLINTLFIGSMGGQRIEAARRALSVFVRSLPTTCYFKYVYYYHCYLFDPCPSQQQHFIYSMVMFGSSSVSLFPGNSVQYTSDSLAKAEAK